MARLYFASQKNRILPYYILYFCYENNSNNMQKSIQCSVTIDVRPEYQKRRNLDMISSDTTIKKKESSHE
ncbi:hypothetical protein FOA32_001973 [Streptococcus sinensis]|nr:hypothetical protein [Streptococcus sinensis]